MPFFIEAKTKADVWCRIEFEDKGSGLAMRVGSGVTCKAFTDWFRIGNGSAIPGLVVQRDESFLDRAWNLEAYSQVPCFLLERASKQQMLRIRKISRLRVLDGIGIDIASLRIPPTAMTVRGVADRFRVYFEAEEAILAEARRSS